MCGMICINGNNLDEILLKFASAHSSLNFSPPPLDPKTLFLPNIKDEDKDKVLAAAVNIFQSILLSTLAATEESQVK